MTLLHSPRVFFAFVCTGGAAAIIAVAACGGDEPGGTSGVPDGASGIDVVASDAAMSDGGADALVPAVIDPLSVDDQSRSGTRIRVVRHRTNDGMRTLGGFYDTDLGTSCRFARATDGKVRCLPPMQPPLTYHLSADCTGPTYVVQPEQCGESLVSVEKTTCLDKLVAAHELGAAVAATVVYESYVGQCRAKTIVAGEVIRPIGAEKPAAAFAEATLEPFPSDAGAPDGSAGPRTIAMLARTADGAVAFYAPWDLPTDAQCVLNETGSGDESRCFPATRMVIDAFADPSCSERLSIADECTADAKLARATRFVDGGTESDFFVAGDAYAGTTYALDGNAACGISGTTTTAFRVGASVPVAPFQIIGTYTGSGATRLRAVGRDFTTFHHPYGFRDSKTDRPCSVVDTASGMYCVPDLDGLARDVFGDAACTQPIRVALIGGPPTASTLTPYFGAACGLGGKTKLFTIGAARTTPYWEMRNGVCEEAPPTTSYELGAEADASALTAFEVFFPEP